MKPNRVVFRANIISTMLLPAFQLLAKVGRVFYEWLSRTVAYNTGDTALHDVYANWTRRATHTAHSLHTVESMPGLVLPSRPRFSLLNRVRTSSSPRFASPTLA